MIGNKAKKNSIFEMPRAQEKEPPEIRISYAENGFIVTCDYNEKYVEKSLSGALRLARQHFEKSMGKKEKEDSED